MVMREFQARMKALEQVEQINKASQAEQVQIIQQQSGEYETLLIALQNDVNRIRALPTFEQRKEVKRQEFLPKWLPFVEQYLADKQVYQNDYFIYCIIYLFDVGDFDRALALAEQAIEQNQAMPDRFSSNLPTFVADQIYKWADKTAAVGLSVEPYFSQTLQNVATQWNLHEVVTAKWLKMAAELLLRNRNKGIVNASGVIDYERLILAIQLCNKAFQLNPKIGVKTMIERCVMRLNALRKKDKRIPPVAGLSFENEAINFDLIIEKLRSCPPNPNEKDGLTNV